MHARQTCFGKGESVCENVAAHEPCPGKRFPNASKDEAGAAANLKKTFRIWKIITERPLNQLVARAKPEVCLLYGGKPREIFRFEAGVPRLLLGKLKYLIAQNWTKAALGACPIFALEASFAREAPFHSSLRRKASLLAFKNDSHVRNAQWLRVHPGIHLVKNVPCKVAVLFL